MLNVWAGNGRLCADPELKHIGNDIPVCSFTLAVDRGYVKQGQERQADFIDIVAWRTIGEFCAKYFHKGQLVAVEGAIQTRTYTDKEGNKRKATEIVANKVDFAESKRSSNDGAAEISRNVEQSDMKPDGNGGYSSPAGDFVEIAGDDDLPF